MGLLIEFQENVIKKQKYWLEDTTGKHHIFEADSPTAALHYFMMEGDHAWTYGVADKEYFCNRLKGKK